jgi:hypothetical protein
MSNRASLFAMAVATAAFAPTGMAADGKWTAVLQHDDFIVGPDLQELKTVHRWRWKFEEGFGSQFGKSAISISAPKCRMDYPILTMPELYPEPGKPEASMVERHALYEAVAQIQKQGVGARKITFDASWYWGKGASGPEPTSCNIWFPLPLTKDAAAIIR